MPFIATQVCTTSKLDLLSLRTEKGGGGQLMTDVLMRWLLEKLMPGVLQRLILRQLPEELGQYLAEATEPCEVSTLDGRFGRVPLISLRVPLRVTTECLSECLSE